MLINAAGCIYLCFDAAFITAKLYNSTGMILSEQCFCFEVLELNSGDLDSCEQFWLDLFQSARPELGYNKAPFAGTKNRHRGLFHSASTKQRIAQTKREQYRLLSDEAKRRQLDRLELGRNLTSDQAEQKRRSNRLGALAMWARRRKAGLNTMRYVVLLAVVLAGCVRPQVEVCNQPKSCVINVCSTSDTCVAKPLELKNPL